MVATAPAEEESMSTEYQICAERACSIDSQPDLDSLICRTPNPKFVDCDIEMTEPTALTNQTADCPVLLCETNYSMRIIEGSNDNSPSVSIDFSYSSPSATEEEDGLFSLSRRAMDSLQEFMSISNMQNESFSSPEGPNRSQLEQYEGLNRSQLEQYEGLNRSQLEQYEGLNRSQLEQYEGRDKRSEVEEYEGLNRSQLEEVEQYEERVNRSELDESESPVRVNGNREESGRWSVGSGTYSDATTVATTLGSQVEAVIKPSEASRCDLYSPVSATDDFIFNVYSPTPFKLHKSLDLSSRIGSEIDSDITTEFVSPISTVREVLDPNSTMSAITESTAQEGGSNSNMHEILAHGGSVRETHSSEGSDAKVFEPDSALETFYPLIPNVDSSENEGSKIVLGSLESSPFTPHRNRKSPHMMRGEAMQGLMSTPERDSVRRRTREDDPWGQWGVIPVTAVKLARAAGFFPRYQATPHAAIPIPLFDISDDVTASEVSVPNPVSLPSDQLVRKTSYSDFIALCVGPRAETPATSEGTEGETLPTGEAETAPLSATEGEDRAAEGWDGAVVQQIRCDSLTEPPALSAFASFLLTCTSRTEPSPTPPPEVESEGVVINEEQGVEKIVEETRIASISERKAMYQQKIRLLQAGKKIRDGKLADLLATETNQIKIIPVTEANSVDLNRIETKINEVINRTEMKDLAIPVIINKERREEDPVLDTELFPPSPYMIYLMNREKTLLSMKFSTTQNSPRSNAEKRTPGSSRFSANTTPESALTSFVSGEKVRSHRPSHCSKCSPDSEGQRDFLSPSSDRYAPSVETTPLAPLQSKATQEDLGMMSPVLTSPVAVCEPEPLPSLPIKTDAPVSPYLLLLSLIAYVILVLAAGAPPAVWDRCASYLLDRGYSPLTTPSVGRTNATRLVRMRLNTIEEKYESLLRRADWEVLRKVPHVTVERISCTESHQQYFRVSAHFDATPQALYGHLRWGGAERNLDLFQESSTLLFSPSSDVHVIRKVTKRPLLKPNRVMTAALVYRKTERNLLFSDIKVVMNGNKDNNNEDGNEVFSLLGRRGMLMSAMVDVDIETALETVSVVDSVYGLVSRVVPAYLYSVINSVHGLQEAQISSSSGDRAEGGGRGDLLAFMRTPDPHPLSNPLKDLLRARQDTVSWFLSLETGGTLLVSLLRVDLGSDIPDWALESGVASTAILSALSLRRAMEGK